jgi:glycosyltransferase involved in cell wall biosynthesis
MSQAPRLSVLLQTFNHAAYITQAVESIVGQRTSFGVEVIAGDDCSSDGTRDVLTTLRARFPGRLSLLFPEANLGAGGAVLALALLAEARGEYVAWLDGDDYWLGADKLERQVAFLDRHRDCSMCWHRACNLYPNLELRPYEDNFDYERGQPFYDLADIVFQNFIPTASVVFRNGLVTLPRDFANIPSPDWFFNALLAEHGRLGFIDEVWSVRRIHAGGVISLKPPEVKLQFNIDCVRMIDAYFRGRFRTQARARLAYLHRELAVCLRHKGHPWKAALQAAQSLAASPADRRWPRGETLEMIVGKRWAGVLDRVMG